MNQLLKMKLLIIIVLLAYVLEYQYSTASDCNRSQVSSCSECCNTCHANNCCNRDCCDHCDCCKTTTTTPRPITSTTTKNPSPITTTFPPISTTTPKPITVSPPTHEANININVSNTVNTTNDVNVPIGIWLVNRNNVIQSINNSRNASNCARRKCTVNPVRPDVEVFPPNQPQLTLPPLLLSTTTPTPLPSTLPPNTQACPTLGSTCQLDLITRLLGPSLNQIQPVAQYDPTQGSVYGQPYNIAYSQNQPETLVSPLYNSAQAVPYNQFQGLGYGGLGYDQLQGSAYDQLGSSPYDQLQGSPYDQLGSSQFNQLQGLPYDQLQGSPYDQLGSSQYDQLQVSPYDQLGSSQYNQLRGLPYNQLQGSPYDQLGSSQYNQGIPYSQQQESFYPFK